MPEDTRFSKNTEIYNRESVSRNLEDWGIESPYLWREAIRTQEQLEKEAKIKSRVKELLQRLELAKQNNENEEKTLGYSKDFVDSFYRSLNLESPEILVEFFNSWSETPNFNINFLDQFESVLPFIHKKIIKIFLERSKKSSMDFFEKNKYFQYILSGGVVNNPEITKFILNQIKDLDAVSKAKILEYRKNLILVNDEVILDYLDIKKRNSQMDLDIKNKSDLHVFISYIPYIKNLNEEYASEIRFKISESLINLFSNNAGFDSLYYSYYNDDINFSNTLKELGIKEQDFIDLLKKFPGPYSKYTCLGTIPEKYHQEIIDSLSVNPESFNTRLDHIIKDLEFDIPKFCKDIEDLYFNYFKNGSKNLDNFLKSLANFDDIYFLEFTDEFLSEMRIKALEDEYGYYYKLLLKSTRNLSYQTFYAEVIQNLKKPDRFFREVESYFASSLTLQKSFSDFTSFYINSESFKLFAQNIPGFVVNNLELFTGYTKEDLMFLIKSRDYSYTPDFSDLQRLEILKNLNLNISIYLELKELRNFDIALFFDALMQKVTNSEINLAEAREICQEIFLKENIDRNSLSLRLIITYYDTFFNFISLDTLFSELINFDYYDLNFLNKFIEKVNLQNIYNSIDPSSDISHFIRLESVIEKLKKDRNLATLYYNRAVKNGTPVDILIKLNESFASPLDIVLSKAYSVFGGYLDDELLKVYYDVYKGSLNKEELKKFGITETGDAGIDQLRNLLNNFKKLILDGRNETLIINYCLKNSLLLKYFQNISRYTEAQFGAGDENSLILKLREILESQRSSSLKEGYERKSVRINSISRDSQKVFEVSAEFKKRYETLTQSLLESIDFINQSQDIVFNQITIEYESCRQKILVDLKLDYEKSTIEKARENIEKRIKVVESLKLPDKLDGNIDDFIVKNFETNFLKLAQYREFLPLLRKVIFYLAFKKTPSQINKIESICNSQGYSFENISELVNFIDHIVNQETWAGYFFDKHSVTEFSKIVSTKALSDELERIDKFEITGTVPFEFVPSRGLLMEFSGQISDACWAEKYSSIADSFPNMTSILMINNRGNKFERLAGSCFLIEADDSYGNPILIIRGLNPLENIINNLEMGDFYEKFTEYVKETSKRLGRRPVIVIDDHQGGSASNRKVVYEYLDKLRGSLTKAWLSPESKITTEFNNYPLEKFVYYLD